MNLRNFLRVYHLPHDVCRQFVRVYEQDPNKNMINEWWRRCGNVAIWDPSLVKQITEHVNGWLDSYKAELGDEVAGALGHLGNLETPNIFKYDPSPDLPNHFNLHADSWNTDTATRQLSIIAYLNSVEEGGETVFPAIDSPNMIRPLEGHVVVFPASWQFMHKALPPVSGPKYILVSWLHFAGPTKFACTPL